MKILSSRRKPRLWIFVVPMLVVSFVVITLPSLSAIYYSLTDWNGISNPKFIGLDNYVRMLEDSEFYTAFKNNFIWLALFMTIPFIFALSAATILKNINKGSFLYRTILFLPYIFPSVVTANIWRNILNPRMGLGNFLGDMGLGTFDFGFLGNPDTALLAVAFIDMWHFWGFLLILFITAMQSISKDIYEAGKLDGTNIFTEFVHIILPGIRPTLVLMFLMVGIWSFLTFDYVYILTQGGPAGSSELLSTIVYKNAFSRFEAGYSAALGLSISVLSGILFTVFVILKKLGWEI